MPQVLGVHNANPINKIPWSSPPAPADQDFEDWWSADRPVFVGRYFGPFTSQWQWKTGESRLNPPDQFLQYVCAFQGITVPTTNAMTAGDASQGTADAVFTVNALRGAITAKDLGMSASSLIYVFLDVEDAANGTPIAISPYYWNSWASMVCHQPLYINGVPSQPFRPAIYCFATNAAKSAGSFSYVPDQGVQNALAGHDPNNPSAPAIATVPCSAFWYCQPRQSDPAAHLPFPEVATLTLQAVTVNDLAKCSGYFPVFTQNSAVNPQVALDVPVELWQFGGNVPYATGQVMDLDFAMAANATDHMAKMPAGS